jgi:hypothetical protein
VEKQEQDVEGKSQAAKDHATDQETVAALGLEDLPKGKTWRHGPLKLQAGGTLGRQPSWALGRRLSQVEAITLMDRNTGKREVLAFSRLCIWRRQKACPKAEIGPAHPLIFQLCVLELPEKLQSYEVFLYPQPNWNFAKGTLFFNL